MFGLSLLYPPIQARSYVRHVHIDCILILPETIRVLQCLASDDLDMTGLHTVELELYSCTYDRNQMLVHLSTIVPIEFRTRILRVMYRHDYDVYHSLCAPSTTVVVHDPSSCH
jgi:hypothetical protein